jgi:HSP20 family molecular chaperone IbpA
MAGRYSSLFFLSRFQAELDRLFKEALELEPGTMPLGEWQPALDIVETATSILILIELPGCSAADLRVEVKGPLLLLSGSRTMPACEAEARFLCLERSPGRFSREVQLFWPVNSHQGTARLIEGLLTVEFPKIEDKRQTARSLVVEERPPAPPHKRAEP